MIAALLNDISERLALVPGLEDAEIRVVTNARFDGLVEGKLFAIVAPQTVLYDQEARDTVKETTTVEIAVAEYFADKEDTRARELLDLVPQIEQTFLGLDLPIGGALYHWDSSIAYGDATSNRVRETPGGILDVDAADQSYIFQAPVYLSYTRFLKGKRPKSVTLVYEQGTPEPKKVIATNAMRGALQIVSSEGNNSTLSMYKSGLLVFV